MTDELEAAAVHVTEGAERLVGALVLGPRVDQRTLRAGERYRRSGVVELDGRVWDEIVLYANGGKGDVPR